MKKILDKAGKLHNWYARFERPISSLSLISGFVINIFALTRVDLFWENFWILVHLVVVIVAVLLINRLENLPIKGMAKNPEQASKLHFWLLSALQFGFGALFGTYLVFYFRSATLSLMWPFLFIIATILVANERLKWHYARLGFQIGLLYLAIFLFTIFAVPVVVHQIGPTIFLLSGALSLVVIAIFLTGLRRMSNERVRGKRMRLLAVIVGSIFVLMNLLYFNNLIPPLPLSLKDADIYHGIDRAPNGNYNALSENASANIVQKISRYFDSYTVFHIGNGSSAYAYTAIFSPVSFSVNIVHEWQYYDATNRAWITKATIPLAISGGREDGYRTYSTKVIDTPGKWRVNVRITSGELIGRLNFRAESGTGSSTLQTISK